LPFSDQLDVFKGGNLVWTVGSQIQKRLSFWTATVYLETCSQVLLLLLVRRFLVLQLLQWFWVFHHLALTNIQFCWTFVSLHTFKKMLLSISIALYSEFIQVVFKMCYIFVEWKKQILSLARWVETFWVQLTLKIYFKAILVNFQIKDTF